MIYFIVIISILYISLIGAFIVGFEKIPILKINESIKKNSFSIVVPFRNEVQNLPTLLNAILNLSYPKEHFEIIFINDDSDDNSPSIIDDFKQLHPAIQIHLINNIRKTNSPKKDAINSAINLAKFNWIVTTDADCNVPEKWLESFNFYIEQKQPVFISAPVKFKEENSFLFHFQNLNFLSLMGSTIGSFGIKRPFLCNGANLCYKKDVFKKIQGFENNSTIASGDDIFLLEKMLEKYPTKTLFLKSNVAVVTTNAENNLSLFFNQQLRWASKTTAYKNSFSKLVGVVVFLMNVSLLTLLISALFSPVLFIPLFIVFALKIMVDFILIQKTAHFLNLKKTLNYFIFVSILHPFFIVLIASFSLFKKYHWKGRTFKK